MSDRPLHLYFCRTNEFREPDALARCYELLDAEERTRHGRFHFEKDRHLYLVAHALTRLALARHLGGGVDPKSFHFAAGPHGRPELKPATPLFFNLSHTEGVVAVGVSEGRELGVDVEGLRPRNATRDVAKRFFAEPEHRSLEGLDPETWVGRFFDFWTLKEAYLKARGAGLTLPLDAFDFRFDEGKPLYAHISESLNDVPDRWQFGLYGVGGTHRMAYCVDRLGGQVELKISEWQPFGKEQVGSAQLLATTAAQV